MTERPSLETLKSASIAYHPFRARKPYRSNEKSQGHQCAARPSYAPGDSERGALFERLGEWFRVRVLRSRRGVDGLGFRARWRWG